jgi:hypothetical protein
MRWGAMMIHGMSPAMYRLLSELMTVQRCDLTPSDLYRILSPFGITKETP